MKKYGDVDAAEKLIVSNLRFVVKIAHEYRSYGFKLSDAVETQIEALVGDSAQIQLAGPRAIGRANGSNMLALVIPCHRVIGKDGSLTGYGGGLWRKRALLDLERGERVYAPSPELN